MIQVSIGNLAWWLSHHPWSEHPAIQGPEGDGIAWRIAQMIFNIPMPALFVYEITVLFLSALPQTPIDGSKANAGEYQSYVW